MVLIMVTDLRRDFQNHKTWVRGLYSGFMVRIFVVTARDALYLPVLSIIMSDANWASKALNEIQSDHLPHLCGHMQWLA
jgi:hypothetical protein